MTFKSTIERVANPRMKSPLASQFSGIVGYQDYVTGKARHLSGVVARGRTLTIRLARPDGAFLSDLASGAACAVPPDTPADPGGINDIPSAGPTTSRRIRLASSRARSNPNYHGDRPRRLDQIVVAIGVDPRVPSSRSRRARPTMPSTGFLPTLDHDWRRSTDPAAKPRSRGTSGIRQPGARGALPAHEHESAALLAGATAACGELRDRPPGPRRPGREICQR